MLMRINSGVTVSPVEKDGGMSAVINFKGNRSSKEAIDM